MPRGDRLPLHVRKRYAVVIRALGPRLTCSIGYLLASAGRKHAAGREPECSIGEHQFPRLLQESFARAPERSQGHPCYSTGGHIYFGNNCPGITYILCDGQQGSCWLLSSLARSLSLALSRSLSLSRARSLSALCVVKFLQFLRPAKHKAAVCHLFDDVRGNEWRECGACTVRTNIIFLIRCMELTILSYTSQ